MKSLIYWMTFQMLIGAWLFVSPFLTGMRELAVPALLNMVLGIITVFLGLVVAMYEIYHKDENACDMEEHPGET